uniref:Methyltransferase like 17 n=1 Tax=Erpetoichthys calabaricus TaxID=27687 RepID=A0A8C4RIP3_ERPCA
MSNKSLYRLLLTNPHLCVYSTVTTHEIQLDNTSQFLDTTPYRKHPGITSMNMVCLPPPLEDAAKILLNSKLNILFYKMLFMVLNYVQFSYFFNLHNLLVAVSIELITPPVRSCFETYQGRKKYYCVLSNKLFCTSFKIRILKFVFPLFFSQIKKRVPDFAPQTLLDFGSGTGTVTWAVHSKWGSTMKEYVCVDSSAAMNNLSDLLLRGGCESQEPHIKGVYFRQFLPVSPKVQFDLVVSAFSLIELPSASDRITTIQTLWRKTQSFLVSPQNCNIEYNFPFLRVSKPCPHALSCPKLVGKVVLPCNFAQSYRRLSLNSLEKFSFVILQRGPADNTSHWPRIVQPVLRRARHVHCHLCCSNGEKQHVVITAKKHGR